MNKEDALQFLKAVKHCLKGIEWSLNCGTLLGAIREGDFIDGDIDVDTVLHDKYSDKLTEMAPKIIECLMRQGCRARLVTEYKPNFIQLSYNGCPGHIGLTGGTYWLKKFFVGKMRTAKIQGVDFPVPEKAEELLTERYGDWKTPLSLNDWNDLWKREREEIFRKFNIANEGKL